MAQGHGNSVQGLIGEDPVDKRNNQGFFFPPKLLNLSGIYSCKQIHLSDVERKSKMGKDSAGILFQEVLFSVCLEVCTASVFSWKDEDFHFEIVINARILCINSSQQERGNWEGDESMVATSSCSPRCS